MLNLTPEQRQQIAIEEFKKEPLENLCHVAILKLGEFAINTNAESATQSTEATINNKRYSIEMVITYKEI
jgi:hypothetical protein